MAWGKGGKEWTGEEGGPVMDWGREARNGLEKMEAKMDWEGGRQEWTGEEGGKNGLGKKNGMEKREGQL